jgi:CTP synthase
MVSALRNPKTSVTVALVGKYTALHDAYLSVVEALKHGGIANHAEVTIEWIESEDLNEQIADRLLGRADAIIVPGGFGGRGIEGIIYAATYAREHKVPYLGICLGMQMAIVDFARNVLHFQDANSTEFAPSTTHPVIDLMPEQKDVTDLGGTMRLGAYPCILREDTNAFRLYGERNISERHRHRYEVNNEVREDMEKAGLTLSGISPDGRIVEMIEYAGHPFYIGTQGHPEFKSRPNRPHPLFAGLIGAACQKRGSAKL